MATINYIGDTDLLYILNKLKNVMSAGYQPKGDYAAAPPSGETYATETYVTNGFVAQEAGKGLSTNDLTDALLTKLNGIAEEADNVSVAVDVTSGNKLATITINGTNFDIYAPKNSELVIDSTMSDTSTNAVENKAIKKYVDDAVGGVVGIKFETAASYSALPTTGAAGTIYLVPNGGSSPNAKDEYVWVDATTKYEKIGTTDVDLSGYVKATDLVEVLTTDIDTMFTNVFGS